MLGFVTIWGLIREFMWVLCIVPDRGLGPRALMKSSFWASILCYFSSGCRMGGEMRSNLFLDIGY